ncbi:MAG TPA: efflux RND transporter periplasmic adaptor subunit [Planctomycetota bacterium]|nr:efflux RND transporter periplasmic adaptor subunit [Planctomycetota bacterium]
MKRPRKKRLFVILVLLVAAGVSIPLMVGGKKPQMVRLARAERFDELKAVVNGSGEIRTRDSVDVQAEIAGVIIELPVREGDVVTKGQVLLKIDPFQTETDVFAARAQLSALEAEAAGQEFQIASSEASAARDVFLKKTAEVELRQAETNLARAQMAYNREKDLLESSIISPDQFELTETQLKLNNAYVEAAMAKIEQHEAQIRAANANLAYARSTRLAVLQRVEGARSSLLRAEDLLKRTTIRSTLNGVIVKLNVEEGERAVPGILSNPQATLMTIADFTLIEAELKVDETDIVNVKLEDIARVVVDAFPETPLSGRVVEIGNSPIISSSSGGMGSSSPEGKDFKVIVRIEGPPRALRPGMSCEADVTTAVKKDVLVIPIQALTMREVEVDSEGQHVPAPPDRKPDFAREATADSDRSRRKELQGVFMKGKDLTALFRPVKTGILGEMDIEVLKGLEPGEEVIVGPLKALRTLKENDKISIDTEHPFRRSLRKGTMEEEESGERR